MCSSITVKTAIPLLMFSVFLSPKQFHPDVVSLYIFGVSSAVVSSCCNLHLSYVSFDGPRCVRARARVYVQVC